MSTNKATWRRSSQTIAGHQCIELFDPQFENAVFETSLRGRNGEIWAVNESGAYKALIDDFRVANKLSKELGLKLIKKYQGGDEAVLCFSEEKLHLVISAIEPFTYIKLAIKKANDFGRSTHQLPPFFELKSIKTETLRDSLHSPEPESFSNQNRGLSKNFSPDNNEHENLTPLPASQFRKAGGGK